MEKIGNMLMSLKKPISNRINHEVIQAVNKRIEEVMKIFPVTSLSFLNQCMVQELEAEQDKLNLEVKI